MILKKSELKSVYVPHLKWDKEMIKYPNMPHDAESKENFEKGYKLFNEEKYDEAFPLLRQAYNKGNYVAAQLLANILFERLNSKEFRDYYYKPKEMYDGVEAWIASDPEKNKKMIKEHDNIIKNERLLRFLYFMHSVCSFLFSTAALPRLIYHSGCCRSIAPSAEISACCMASVAKSIAYSA